MCCPFFFLIQNDARQTLNCFRQKRNSTTDNRKYSETIRKFSLTVFCHSPRCYKYIREKFQNTLPHPRTLTKWYSQSDCHGEPGILTEAVKTLQSAAAQLAKEGKQLLASLAFDEMAIRRHVQYDHQKKEWLGYIRYGRRSDDGSVPIAKNVLVFMITILNSNISIPVAYFPITSLDAIEKRDLLIEILTGFHRIGVKVVNVTFDGLKSNRAMCELLGVSFDPKNIIPFFHHPVDDSLVCIMLDNCHMLKLLRNLLGDRKKINDRLRSPIEWKYFELLETCRVNSKFVTHRLNKRHLQYNRNRMNVWLAAETLSTSVASSMSHLMESGDTNFQNAESTIHFIKQINDLFDVMNTKKIRVSGSVFRSALNVNNADTIFAFFNETSNYLKSLKLIRKLCVNSLRNTGFIGFIINMASVKHLYQELVVSGQLQSLPTFFFSQDPLGVSSAELDLFMVAMIIPPSNNLNPQPENCCFIVKWFRQNLQIVKTI